MYRLSFPVVQNIHRLAAVRVCLTVRQLGSGDSGDVAARHQHFSVANDCFTDLYISSYHQARDMAHESHMTRRRDIYTFPLELRGPRVCLHQTAPLCRMFARQVCARLETSFSPIRLAFKTPVAATVYVTSILALADEEKRQLRIARQGAVTWGKILKPRHTVSPPLQRKVRRSCR